MYPFSLNTYTIFYTKKIPDITVRDFNNYLGTFIYLQLLRLSIKSGFHPNSVFKISETLSLSHDAKSGYFDPNSGKCSVIQLCEAEWIPVLGLIVLVFNKSIIAG